MAKVLCLNLVFIFLYCLFFKVETRSDILIPNMDNMVEYDSRTFIKEPVQRNNEVLDIQRNDFENNVYPKLTRKKHKKKNHNNKKNTPDTKITDKDKVKKFKKKKSRRFIKSAHIEDESIESGETKKRSPVDIIVHIKMND